MGDIGYNNNRILTILSEYINNAPDAVSAEMVYETAQSCGVSAEEAFRILFCGIFDIYSDRELRNGWIRKIFKRLDSEVYENDPYKRLIKFPKVSVGGWTFFEGTYKPFEVFVYNDLISDDEGRIIPQIGFFEKEYKFPAVSQNGREWMLITPNEIETMKAPVEGAFGDVVTYGLGLGYFAFMASEKQEVSSVTVVERDEQVIKLFLKYILPQFPCKEKIRIIHGDALEYAAEEHPCDYVFADIWHDPSDGCELYKKLKALERDGIKYSYWIENTLKYYL